MGDLQLRKPGQSILGSLDLAPQLRQGLLSAAAATNLGSGASDTASGTLNGCLAGLDLSPQVCSSLLDLVHLL